MIEQSHAITSWGMKVLLSYVAGLSGLAGFAFSDQNDGKFGAVLIVAVCIVAVFSIYVFTILFALIAARSICIKGSPPKEIFKEKIFTGLVPEEGFKILLFNEVERLQDKIDQIANYNRRRIGQYRAVLKVSLILVALAVFAIVNKILSES